MHRNCNLIQMKSLLKLKFFATFLNVEISFYNLGTLEQIVNNAICANSDLENDLVKQLAVAGSFLVFS